MSGPSIEPISYDADAAFLPEHGIEQAALVGLAPRLSEVRQEVLETDVALLQDPERIPKEKRPLDAAFIHLPDKLLWEYRQQREASELGRILAAAARLGERVDRVVVLGIGGSYMGARALKDACCQPYFNELSRAERGGRPRMYFEGNNVDNDALHGLFRLLERRNQNADDARWAIVVISKSGGTLETAVAFRVFLDALRNSCSNDAQQVAELVLPVTGKTGRLAELADALGCQEGNRFIVPDGVGGRFSILSAVGLLPAAVLGIDIVKLLEGAAAMNEHFRTAPPAENVVLKYVGVCHLMDTKRGATIRVLSPWASSLESVGLWYDQLLSESLGKNERVGATPITAVNTRDLHSRAQQHQEGRRDKLITNIIVDRWRCDPLRVGTSDLDQDKLNEFSGKTVPDIMAAAIEGTNDAYREDGRPTADIRLPAVDEASLGQLFQMLMLATVVEGRLLGINPYGQPGVEKYKQNMNRSLRSR